MDRDKNNVLTFDEIHDYLSEKQGERFDQDLCQDLFARMDRNHDNEVTLEEFVESYIEVEELITRQIRTLNKEIKKSRAEYEDSKEKLKKSEQTERLNSVGIMQGSVLTVTVKSAQNLFQSSADSSNFVALECSGQKVETKAVSGATNLIWEESFSFPIAAKGLDLKLRVLSKGVFGNKFIGKVTIPSTALADQLKHEQYFALQADTAGEAWQGRICLELQWIWSRVKYYKDITNEWENIIKSDQERLDDLKDQLEKLRKPFGYMKDLNLRNEVATPTSGTFQFEEKLVNKLEELTNGKISMVVEHEGYLYLSLILYMVFAVLMNFLRPDFVNVCFI